MRIVRLSLVPAGVLLGLGAEWAALHRGPLEAAVTDAMLRLAVADLVVGWTLIGCGLVAWWRRPQSWIGVLLTAAGFSWFLGTFSESSSDSLASFGAVFVTLHRGPLVHAMLSYPTGRVEGVGRRAVVALAYVSAAVVDVGQSAEVTLGLVVALVGVAATRYFRSAGPQRRAHATAAAAALAFAAVLTAAALASLGDAGAGTDRAVLWAYQTVIFAIALLFLADLLRGRWTQATVTGLVVELGELSEQGVLRDRLASALGDPSLAVGYWVAEESAYLDEAGRRVELPEPGSGRDVTIVEDETGPLAALVHGVDVGDDGELFESVAAAARIAVRNVRLRAEIRSQVEELEASRRRIVEAADTERQRLERELHTGAERRLARVQHLIEGAAADGRGAAMLDEAREELGRAQTELREFAAGVHPRVLTEGGLPAALADLAERAPVPVEFSTDGERAPAAVEAAVYFVCSEALANVGKYAQASTVTIAVTRENGLLTVMLRDDGVGGASLDAGSGLRGLADRVEALGGSLGVESAPGEGTLLVAELPLEESA
jgi:signal transduction histidine kinase